jgi:hypothetical protein
MDTIFWLFRPNGKVTKISKPTQSDYSWIFGYLLGREMRLAGLF